MPEVMEEAGLIPKNGLWMGELLIAMNKTSKEFSLKKGKVYY